MKTVYTLVQAHTGYGVRKLEIGLFSTRVLAYNFQYAHFYLKENSHSEFTDPHYWAEPLVARDILSKLTPVTLAFIEGKK